MGVELLTQLAIQAIGTPYKWGGQNLLDGFDCSGFVRYLLRSVGQVPFEDLSAQGIHDYLMPSSRKSLCEGAMLFFGSPNGINHTAYCLSSLLMVEAFGDSSIITKQDAQLYRSAEGAMVRLYPIDRRKDLVAALRPRYRNLGE